MPIYEYRCEACGHALDALQKVSDEPLTDCPACGASELRRLISAPRFRLKGSGWYETDFKSDKDRKRNLADAPEPAKSGGKTEGGDKAAASGETSTKSADSGGKTGTSTKDAAA
jgi:putative FmdB family regulatory protein